MIFKYKPPIYPKDGYFIKKFAILPVKLTNKDTIWLETYYVVLKYETIKCEAKGDDLISRKKMKCEMYSTQDFLEFKEKEINMIYGKPKKP